MLPIKIHIFLISMASILKKLSILTRMVLYASILYRIIQSKTKREN